MEISQTSSDSPTVMLRGRAHARSRLLSATGQLARYCDKSEHNEVVDAAVIASSAMELRSVGVTLLRSADCLPAAAMADRLSSIEQRNVLYSQASFDVRRDVGDLETWRGFQLAQARHDAYYHPDVLGQPKDDQLRHYTLHLAKLCWLLDLAVTGREPFDSSRSADIAIFGVKLATLAGAPLPSRPIDEAF